MKNNNCPKRLAKAICQKNMETVKSKEKKAVSKAESVGKQSMQKQATLAKGGHNFYFDEKILTRKHFQT